MGQPGDRERVHAVPQDPTRARLSRRSVLALGGVAGAGLLLTGLRSDRPVGVRPAPAVIEPGPPSDLPIAPDADFPLRPLRDWTGGTSAEDLSGPHRRPLPGIPLASPRLQVRPGHEYLVKLRCGGSLLNSVQVDLYDVARAYVRNTVTYAFTSGAFEPPVVGTPVTQTVRITVPDDSTVTGAVLLVRGEATRVYGWRIDDVSRLPRLPLYRMPLPYRGAAVQSFCSTLAWLVDTRVDERAVRRHVAWLVETLDLRPGDGLRVFLNADCGMLWHSGLPTGWQPRAWDMIDAAVRSVSEHGLQLLPVLYYPTPFPFERSFRREVVHAPDLARAYRARTTELAAHLDAHEVVRALDLVNEYAWALSNSSGDGPRPGARQVAACFEDIADAARRGSGKPVVASLAYGHEGVAALLVQDPASYDVLSYHSYSAPLAFFQPQWDVPVIAGEYGPDVTLHDERLIAEQTIDVMHALPAMVSAAYLWTDFALVHPTPHREGRVRNPSVVQAFRASRPPGA